MEGVHCLQMFDVIWKQEKRDFVAVNCEVVLEDIQVS